MSWLVSLILAGSFITGETGIPQPRAFSGAGESPKTIVLDETERFEQTYPLSANGRVSVSNITGSIAIDVWDSAQVRLEAVKTAATRERMDEVAIKVDSRPDSLTVETDYGKARGQGWNKAAQVVVDYRLTVPRGAVLADIETVSGTITIANASNSTKASAINGQIRASNLRGTADLSTVNGVVNAEFDELGAGSRVTLATVNGQVNLTVPSDVSATFRAETVNGGIANDFGLPVRKGQWVGRELHGRLGNGGATVSMSSVNGQLNVKRKADGKNPNPATNLLDEKQGDGAVTPDAVRRRPEPDEARIRTEAEKAAAEARKEFEKMRPELEKIRAEAEKQSKEAARISEQILNSERVREQFREAQRLAEVYAVRPIDAGFGGGFPTIERKSAGFPVKGVPKVKISAGPADLTVRGWDRPEVRYSLTRLSKQRSASEIDVRTEAGESEVGIEIVLPDGAPSGDRVRIEVLVPKKSDLRIFADGEVRIENVTGEIKVEGANSAVNVRDSGGSLTVATVGGPIRVLGFEGSAETRSGVGEISLEGRFTALSAKTDGGNVILNLPPDAAASIVSGSRDVVFVGLPFVFADGTPEGGFRYNIGAGGEALRVSAGTGKVVVRNAEQIRSVL